MAKEYRSIFSIPATVNEAGRFECVAISSGNGNGWNFSSACLSKSLPLWDNANCMIDHAYFSPHSVKDFAGIFTDPTWNADENSIHLTLQTMPPGGHIVEELGRIICAMDPNSRPAIGFSADLEFTATGRNVEDILRIHEICLVYNPARGGEFVRALNSQFGGNMSPTNPNPAAEPQPPAQNPDIAAIQADVAAMQALLATQREQDELRRQAEQTRAIRAQMCTYLLDAGLASSNLPPAMQDHVRQQFTGRVFEAPELTAAIESARKLVSDLSGPQSVQGAPQFRGMFSNADQLQLAVNDLFGIPRDDKNRSIQVHRLSGIREAYHLLTGDYNLHGGYYPERTQLATTADFTGLVKNALNKIVVNQWEALGRAGYDWWEKVSTQEHFTSLQSITGTLVGSVGALPTIAEGAEYTELAIGDSPETASFTKYGGYIPLTLELIDRDETRKLVAYARELANTGLRKISALVAAIFTDNSGVGPTMADTGALFNATAVTTAGGHANLLTTALSGSQWETVSAAVYNQPLLVKNAATYYGTGAKQAVNPKYCLVPRALQLTARQIFYPELARESGYHYQNLQRDTDAVVTVPEWTDATDWAAVCDPTIAPAIFVGERFGLMPEVYVAGDELSPAVFMNDEHRLKVRLYVAVWVNDFRPLHKSNV